VQEDAIGFDACQRYNGRNGDFEAEQHDEVFDGLGEHQVPAIGHPRRDKVRESQCHMLRICARPYQKSAESTQAVFSQPEDRKTSISML
jgi:hypothetical protein